MVLRTFAGRFAHTASGGFPGYEPPRKECAALPRSTKGREAQERQLGEQASGSILHSYCTVSLIDTALKHCERYPGGAEATYSCKHYQKRHRSP